MREEGKFTDYGIFFMEYCFQLLTSAYALTE